MNLRNAFVIAAALGLGSVSSNLNAGNGPGTGSGPMLDLADAVCETVSGIVAEVGYNGSGYLLDTGETELLSLFGLGPSRFWDNMGITQPLVGETIDAYVCWVTFSDGSEKAIAVTVTIDGTEVLLRDAETGQPAWRGVDNANGADTHAEAGGGGQVRAGVGRR